MTGAFRKKWKSSYQQHEEDKEHIWQEENWSKNPVGLFNFAKVEISQNGSEQSEDGIWERAEVFNLCSKKEISQLSESKEHNEEHHTKSSHIFSTLWNKNE